MSWAQVVNVATGVVAGGIITFLVSRFYFHRTSEEMSNMLRTFAVTLEQLDLGIVFLRDKDGEVDLSKPGRITGKAAAVLPPLRGSGEGTAG